MTLGEPKTVPMHSLKTVYCCKKLQGKDEYYKIGRRTYCIDCINKLYKGDKD